MADEQSTTKRSAAERTGTDLADPLPQLGFGRPTAIAAVVVAALLFAAAAGLLYYKTMTASVPTAVLVVEGSEAYAGDVVRVEGVALPQPIQTTLDKASNYIAKINLVGGAYKVIITHGRDAVSQEIMLQDLHQGVIRMSGLFPQSTTAPVPAGLPDTRPGR